MMRLLRIAGREYVAYVKTVGFWLSMLLMPVIGGLAMTAPVFLEHRSPPPTLAVIDQTGQHYREPVVKALTRVRKSKPMAHVVELAPDPAIPLEQTIRKQLTQDGREARKLTAAAIIKGSGEAITVDYWSRNLADNTLERAIRSAVADEMQARRLATLGIDQTALDAALALGPRLTTYSPKVAGRKGVRDWLPSVAGFGTAMLLWMMIFTGAGILLNSVIEEKSSRVLEVLLASASVPEIMFGKILGVAGVTLTVLGVWATVGGALFVSTNPGMAREVASVLLGQGLLGYFAFYLIGGYLMYAAIFTAIGSFCETTREAQTLLGPIMALLMIPMIFLTQAIRQPDSPMLEALSWAPPFAPFLMPARAASEPPLWQVAGTGALMAATVVLVVWIAGRAFRAGALSTGRIDLKGLIARLRSAD